MPAGTKRVNDDDSHDRRSKPRDWRDAFLSDEDEGSSRRDSRDRDRSSRHTDHGRHDRYNNERRGEGHRGDERRRDDYNDRDRYGERYDDRRGSVNRDKRDYHDRDRDRYGARYSGSHPRDRDDKGSRRYSNARSDRSREDRRTTRGNDKEEGEIESPVKASNPLPRGSATSVNPRMDNGHLPPSRGFQPVSIPTGPRINASQTRPSVPSQPRQNPLDSASAITSAAYSDSAEPVVVLEEETDPEKALEERRKKREEILAKFKANGGRPALPTSGPPEPQKFGTGAESVTSGGLRTSEKSGLLTGTTTGATPLLKALGTKSSTFLTPDTSANTPNAREPSLAPTPMGKDFDLEKHQEEKVDIDAGSLPTTNGPGISAAEYDPIMDKKDDEEKRQKDSEIINGADQTVKEESAVDVDDEWEEVEIEEDDDDDEMDMFAAFGDDEQPKKKRKVTVRRRKNGAGAQNEIVKPKKQSVLDVVDNVDDTDGYYRITPGEIMDDGRYQVTISLGKGMFSGVVKAKVLKAVGQERRQDVVGKEVAIKVIRSQESMYVAGRKEAQILKKLNDADPEDKKHIVRMEHQFEHRGHLCIVTESMSMNLRDVIKRFGKDVGLNMRAVRAYAHQMFLALSLMRKCSIVHADIKPDNILVTENKATLKICDLGSAAEISEGEITPYLVSRFYRAPEIILGLPYDTAIDVWSVGCTLYELYTGKILFPGRSNNHMLLLMMEVKGKINHRLIKKASLGEMHFDETMNFISIEKDKITGQDTLKTLALSKATRDLKSRLLPPSSVQLKMKDDELKQLHNFIDLLDKCLQLDPAKRLTPREALLHPFLSSH